MSKLIVFILSALSPALVLAQSGTSSISGNIKDDSGAAIPSAKVKVVNQGTGVTSETASNESGIYRVGSLVPGSYQVEVELEGFERLVRSALVLQVDQALTADVTLSVGKQSETVTVTDAAPLTESQSSNISQVVNRQMLAGLPLPNRAASSLAALSPGW